MPLGGQRPAPREHAPRQPVCKLLFFADRHHGLCLFLDGLDVPAKLMDMAGMDPGMHQAIRMGEFSGSGQCYIDVRYGLVRIAQYGEDPGKIGQAHDYKVVDTHEGSVMVLLGIIQGHRLRIVRPRGNEIAAKKRGEPYACMGHSTEEDIVLALRESQVVLTKLLTAQELSSRPMK